MKPSLLLVLLAAAAPAHAWIHPPAPASQEKKAADPLDEMRAEWDAVQRPQDKKSPDPAVVDAKRVELLERARAVMKADPRGDLAVRTRVWVATSRIDRDGADELLRELLTDDVASAGLADLADALPPGAHPDARAHLETLVAKSGDRTVRGRAVRMLSDHAKHELERLRAVEKREAEASVLAREFGADRAQALETLGVAGVEKEYVALLERVVKEFGDVKDARGRDIGPRAEGALFELQRLQIGMLAPDIEGEDVHGVPFKLSDYKGKVIFLDFWGHW